MDDLEPLKILLVDDNPNDLKLVERWITVVDGPDLADIVGRATSGAEAIELAANTPFDLAIVDYKMPVMDGLQTAEQLKTVSPDSIVMILTSHDDKRAEIVASPFVDRYHEKLFMETLYDDLRELVSERDEGSGASGSRLRALLARSRQRRS